MITEEPSTLVYTLLPNSGLEFKHFFLIVRSLHTYMVEDIIAHEENQNVHVKLSYQASVENATKKLGALKNCVFISKLSSFVEDSEISLLDELKKKYGFGGSTVCSEKPTQKRRKYIPSAECVEENSE